MRRRLLLKSVDIEAIKSSMVLWYDIKRQGCTNESMAENPVLKDLSGNGYDATCYNFAWTTESGITEDNALVSDGVDDYCITPNVPAFNTTDGYTVIALREHLNYNQHAPLVSKSYTAYKGAFSFETEYRYTYSFGIANLFGEVNLDKSIGWQTKGSYMGTSLEYGEDVDIVGDITLFVFRQGDSRHKSAALYSLLIFDRDLTTDEIEWVIKNLIET